MDIQLKISQLEQEKQEFQSKSQKEIDDYLLNVKIQLAIKQGVIDVLKELLGEENQEQ